MYNSIDFELESGLEINIPSHPIHVLNYAWPLTSTKNGSRTAVMKKNSFSWYEVENIQFIRGRYCCAFLICLSQTEVRPTPRVSTLATPKARAYSMCNSFLPFQEVTCKFTDSNITYYLLKWPGIVENSAVERKKSPVHLFTRL